MNLFNCSRNVGWDIKIKDVKANDLEAVLLKLKQAGAKIEQGEDWLQLDMQGRRPKAVDIDTAPFSDSYRYASTNDGLKCNR